MDLSYLDTISNKELHAKCLQYGLPNIPVTDSSRQVIQRRLRAAILGVPMNKKQAGKDAAAAKKKTPRRETIHSSKATPAVEITETRVAGKSPSRNNNNNVRRTVAATTGNLYPLGNTSTRSVETTTTVSDIGSQSEDDDYYNIGSYGHRNQWPRGEQRDAEELRRQVSLGKSELLTTSYTRGVEGQPGQYAEDDTPQAYTYQRPHVAPSLLGHHQDRTYSAGLPKQNLTHSLLNSTSYNEDATDYKNVEPQRYSYNGSAAPFQTGAASTSSIRQRQTIGASGFARGRLIQPTYRVNTLYPQLNEFYDETSNTGESMEVDTDSEPEVETQQQQRSYGRQPVESPYVSSFSRQLNAGKQSSPLARPQGRVPLANEELDSPMAQFRVFLKSLDQRFHLKFYFFLMLAVMFTTLVYVVLTP